MRKKISAILFYFFFLISCLLIPLIYLYVTLNINAAKNTSLSVSSVSAAQKQDTTTPSDTSGAVSYTHLDVYKRQMQNIVRIFGFL